MNQIVIHVCYVPIATPLRITVIIDYIGKNA
jgi:hypothetical protein